MTNPGPMEKLEIRVDDLCKRLRGKVPWVGAGVIVAVGSIIAMLTYSAYSGEQERQCGEIAKNSVALQECKTNAKVVGVQLEHIKDQLKELKTGQKEQFQAIMDKLEENSKTGGDSE